MGGGLQVWVAGVGVLLLAGWAGSGGCANQNRSGASAGRWTPPTPVVQAGLDGANWGPALTFTGDGHAIATFDGSSEGDLSHVLAAEPGARPFREIGRARLLAGPVAFGSRGVAYLHALTPLAGPRRDDGDGRSATALGVAPAADAGSLGRVRAAQRSPTAARSRSIPTAGTRRRCGSRQRAPRRRTGSTTPTTSTPSTAPRAPAPRGRTRMPTGIVFASWLVG